MPRTIANAVLAAAFGIAWLPAQSPLMMPFNANSGGADGWQVFFDLDVVDPSGVTITGLDVNCGNTAVGTVGSIEVWVGPTTHVNNATNASLWTLAVRGGVIAQGANVPSYTCLGAGLFLAPGPHGVAVRHVGVGLSYTNGNGTNQTGSTAELLLSAGAATSALFSGSFFSPRVFNGNVHYHVGNVPGTGCAQTETFGTGCYRGTTTFYETFAALAGFDFAGSAGAAQVLHATRLPQGYLIANGTPTWFTPTGVPVLDNAGVPAAMGDTNFSRPLNLPFVFPFPRGSTAVVHAASDGYLNLGATTSNACDASPTAAELLTQAPRLCPLWCNLQPATNVLTNPQSGIYFDVDPGNQTVYVTWLDVADRSGSVPPAGSTSVNVQVALHASGDFEFRYRAIVPNVTTAAVLLGASKGIVDGLVAIDPGSVDLSAALPLLTDGPDDRPLVHTVGLPRIGTTLQFAVSDVESVVPLAFLFFGDAAIDPGIPLASIGAPDCFAHTNANLTSATIPVSASAGTGAVSLPIPMSAALIGAQATSQAVAFTVKNALGLATSNGVTWAVGN